MDKRQFLKIAGSASVIFAAGGAAFVSTRRLSAALLPWKNAGFIYDDPMRNALSYAILAPNPHNRQPWIVSFISKTEVLLTCDLDRLLPVTDPFSRQIVIGLGCFLELFKIAASAIGYRADIEYFPSGEPANTLDNRPIAKLSIVRQERIISDPLFPQILKRRTNREPFDGSQTISRDVMERVKKSAGKTVHMGTSYQGKQLQELREITRDAMMVEFHTPQAHRESVDLMRIGRSEIENNPDGISLGGAFLEVLSLAGILTRQSLADPNSQAFKTGVDMFEQAAMSSMGFVWINTEGNERSDQIEAGRAYMRIALAATAEGLAMQPMSQALQEYKAMVPHYKTIHDMLTDAPLQRVQMLVRLGFGKIVDPSPRWKLSSRIA